MYSSIFDLHTHILPDMDDGAADLQVSQAMLRIAAESGTSELFATPHVISGSWLPDWETILREVDQLNQLAAGHPPSITVHPGAEVAMDWSLLELLSSPGPYCLGGGRFILVELPLGALPTYADEFLFTLQTRDFVPVLGHPERNPDVKKDPSRLRPWLERGIFVQMNASSLLGTMGSRTQATAVKLLEAGQVHFIGSDAHGVGVRRPDLREASAMLGELLGSEGARRLLEENPAQLLRDRPEELYAPRAILPSAPTDWLSRMKALWR